MEAEPRSIEVKKKWSAASFGSAHTHRKGRILKDYKKKPKGGIKLDKLNLLVCELHVKEYSRKENSKKRKRSKKGERSKKRKRSIFWGTQ